MHPSGPEAGSTYWKRRALVLVVLVVLVALLVLGIRGLFGRGTAAEDQQSTVSSSTAESASGSTAPSASGTDSTSSAAAAATPGAPSACDPADISVAATTDKASYALTDSAELGMTIQSKGREDCTFDVGSQALELTVMSGNDRIWSSDDCQKAAESRVVTVKPGDAGRFNSRIEWDFTRSTSACPTTTSSTKVSPGTYTLVSRAGDLRSQAKSFSIK